MDAPGRIGKTICLTMIVKDESHVIQDTLKNLWSYLPFDTYVISDTGSSDNTKALIKAFFDEQGVKGEIFDDPWVDFGHNRTLAFRHAANKSDYVFVWDADDRIHGHFKLPATLDADHYHFTFRNGDTAYVRSQLFNNRKRWKYVGVLHEYPACEEAVQGPPVCVLGAYHFASNRTGARNKDPLKYVKDAAILERAFYQAVEDKDPLQNRYAFYCAQSYRSASMPDKALAFYKQVLALKDAWVQEKYMACIEIFTLLDEQKTPQEGIAYLIESFTYDKTRIEGIYRLVQYYCIRGQPEVARAFYGLIQQWYETQYDPDTISTRLFAKKAEYDYYLPYYMIIVADRLQDRALGVRMMERIVQGGYVPPTWWSHNLIHNFQFFLDALPADSVPFCHSFAAYVDKLALEPKHHAIVERVLAKFRGALGGDLKPIEEGLTPRPQPTQTQTPRILLTFTTCKRWDLFQQTVRSILRSWTDIRQVDAWFCVDDNSSEEDRAAMRTTFPWIEYHMKGPHEKGHRESMNIIWNKLRDVKPTFWIHMEDDWLFFKREAYVTRAIKALDTYRGRDVQQVVFNRNYGVVYGDIDRVGGKVLEPGLLLHEKRDGLVGKNCGYWPHYSLQPSMSRVEAILSLGNYDSPNRFFERDYANKYFTRGYQTAFFNGMFSIHIGKQHWETEGKNAYALNDLAQFNAQTVVAVPQPQPQPLPEPEPTPLSYPQFTGTMADHLQQLRGLMNQTIPFALIRPSDGEYSVIKGQTLTNCDKWTFQAGGTLQTDLTEAVQTDVSGLYIGIPCNTCNKPWNCTQTIYDEYRALVKTQNITYANIFMNANWPAFVDMLKEDTRPLYVVTSGTTGTTELPIKDRHIIDPFLVNQWDKDGAAETARILEFVKSKTNALICFSAGPLSKVWIPKCWALNPTNTYLDVGAALDPFTKGPEVKSRFYTNRAHPFAKEACVFRERQIVKPRSKKSLVYMCVFHNKDYLKLLELLLGSMKLFSRMDTFDVLVMTSPDFEKEVQRISDLVQIPVKIHLCDFKTFLESASARLHIHTYPEIDSYGNILYIDTDIVVQNDLMALLSEPLEEKVYALPEGTIEHEYHGGWYFDFKTIDKDLPGLNSGILLFPNTPTIRTLFKECAEHIKQEQQSGKPMPSCLDQPFLNYHFIKGNHYDVNLMKKYALIYCYNPPLPPSEPTTIALCHFVWPLGNASHKLDRMRKHVTHLLNNYRAVYPSDQPINTRDVIGNTYTWGTGQIQFKKECLITTWAKGSYQQLTNQCFAVEWNGYQHLLFLEEDRKRGISIRKGDCMIGIHTYKECIPSKQLIYICVFNNPKYVNLLELLLTSLAKTTLPPNTDLLIMTSSNLKPSIQEIAESLELPVQFMLKDAVLTNHEAACMRLKIFDYPTINDYDKLLYLDTDILIQHSLTPLLEQTIQDQVYALEEGTIDQGYHGSWYFDFKTIHPKTPAINSGVLLFPNTPLMKRIFQETDADIEGKRARKERLPDAYDQPFINYHFIKAGKCNSALLKDYVQIFFQNPSSKPIVPICHFAGNMGDADDKLPRMKAHIERFIVPNIPGKYLAYACVFYNKDYTELLRLLIASTKFYSFVQGITFLVLTSKEIEPAIQELAKSYQFPIVTKTFDYTTLFQAACARLSIFDYEDIGSYEKILYLDTDILVKGDLKTLFELPLEDKLYGLESGFTDSVNFGAQFFNPPIKTSGINSGTLLFRNSSTIQSLFQRIRSHVDIYTKHGTTPPYALDQPFINYHAIKDNVYDNQVLKPYVALFEGEEGPENETTAIVCHFSFPIGNFGHKCNRMKRYLHTLLTTNTKNVCDVKGGYSWGAGTVHFINETDVQTTWGCGKYSSLDTNRVCVYWNNHHHVIRFDTSGSYFGMRIWPEDFVTCSGVLLRPIPETIVNTMNHVDYLQIGSHIGNTSNDHLFNTNLTNKNIILIEPVPFLFEQLKQNYRSKLSQNNIAFLNIAISDKNDTLQLYIPSMRNDFSKFPNWASQLASTNSEHISKHMPTLAIDIITVPCVSLNTLIHTIGIKTIDYLMIDTEGHDYDILMNLDLSVIKPTKIRFENKHMDGVLVRGTRYMELLEHLYKRGYKKTYEDSQDTIVSL